MCAYFNACLQDGEAVLRFPYDDELRLLLRAVPGRRWDPEGRTWRVPLDPERADSLARLLLSLPMEPQVTPELAHELRRLRGRRHGQECVLDLARPDESWWLSFATDRGGETVAALLAHPGARRLPAIGRGLVPLDAEAVRLVEGLLRDSQGLHLSEDASHALTEHASREPQNGEPQDGEAGRGSTRLRDSARSLRNSERSLFDAELRRARGGSRWVLIAGEHAALARTLAEREGLRVRQAVGGGLALAAAEREAFALAAVLDGLGDASVEPRLLAWLQHVTAWRGTIDVGGPPEEPVFLLIGEPSRLPPALRERAIAAPGGASVPLTLASWELIETKIDGWSTLATRRCVAALREGQPAPASVLEVSSVHEQPAFVLAPGHDPGQQVAFAALPGALLPQVGGAAARRSGHEHERLPAIHADPFCVPKLDAFLAEHEPWVAADALELLQETREQHARAAGLVALSEAVDAPLHVPGLGGELKPFQRAGVSYLLQQRRTFLADEQGLGKTIEALATLQAADAYPAIVVCPASLKLNWRREIERWLPGRSVSLLAGTGAGGSLTGAGTRGSVAGVGDSATGVVADITIVNYDIVAARLAQLCALAPQALVLDESHYCKNASAKRTRAVQQLAACIDRDGIVLALTGTPVINRPPELVSQLRILGRLNDFGSGAQFGRRFRGGDAHMRLHWHLRARCFARRLKSEVLPQLPAKTRAVVPVELDNEAEYRLAERDLLAWLRSQPLDLAELDAKVAAALRAERLVRLNALKLLAAQGKLHAALAWVHDFLSSGERLVLFAHHRRVQRAVLERFPSALHVLGQDSHEARDAAIRRFQEPDDDGNRLIVCSIDTAGHGITLTRASNVAFLELDWTPAKHDQAEDRCHRIGQQDAVNATYLLAAGTIDETIATLLERKRGVIGAVTDGRPEDEQGIVEGLVHELRGAPYRHLRAVA